MELVKGVHVIETYATTTLLVDDRLILVDTSADADAGKVVDYLNHIRVKPKDLSTIFITHTHPDHVGGLAAIKHGSPAKVAAHRIEAEFIARKRLSDGPCETPLSLESPRPCCPRKLGAEVYEGARFIRGLQPLQCGGPPPC